MSERLKEHAWKVCIRETVSWVRIPPSPPLSQYLSPAFCKERGAFCFLAFGVVEKRIQGQGHLKVVWRWVGLAISPFKNARYAQNSQQAQQLAFGFGEGESCRPLLFQQPGAEHGAVGHAAFAELYGGNKPEYKE